MMKKNISAICAVLLTLTAVSCQKTNTEQYLDMQEEMIGLMESIKDQSSAEKIRRIAGNHERRRKEGTLEQKRIRQNPVPEGAPAASLVPEGLLRFLQAEEGPGGQSPYPPLIFHLGLNPDL